MWIQRGNYRWHDLEIRWNDCGQIVIDERKEEIMVKSFSSTNKTKKYWRIVYFVQASCL